MTSSGAVAALTALKGEADFKLRGPATADAVDAMEAALGAALPSDVRELYLAHDGQEWDAPGIWLGNYWMPTEEVGQEIANWRSLNDELAGALDDGHSSEPAGAIQEIYWHPQWLPIASDGGGNFIAIDLSPGTNGVSGQVINAGRDEEEKYVLADSVSQFFERLLAHVAQGTATIVDEDDDKELFVGSGTYGDFLAPFQPALEIPSQEWTDSLDDSWQRYLEQLGLQSFLRLTEFWNRDTGITDFRPLTMCSRLRSASIHPSEPLTSLEELPELPSLRDLYVSTLSLQGIQNFPNLSKLTLSDAATEVDLTPAIEASALKSLTVQGQCNLHPLAALESLQDLRLEQVSAAQWNEVEKAPQLTSLHLGNAYSRQVLEGSFLRFSSLEQLEILELYGFENVSLQSLQSLAKLTRLKLGVPKIDLAPLAECKSLKVVELSQCEQIDGVDALRKLTGLKEIVGPFSVWKQLHQHLPHLPWSVITGSMTEAEVDEYMNVQQL